MRNTGNKHLATLRLLQQARVKLIMTATPLHTAPRVRNDGSLLAVNLIFVFGQDIASMGRLVGLPHFFDEASFIEEKSDAATLRQFQKPGQRDEASLSAERVRIVRRLQGHCKGHFLCRTSRSVNDQGAPLIPLPPYEEIIGILNLTERENAVIHDRSEAAKAA